MKRLLILVLLLIPIPILAQNSRYDDVAWKFTSGGTWPAAGVTVSVCVSTGSGIPCSPLATITSDQAGLNPITGNGSSFVTDSRGNYGFFAAPGTYIVTLTGTGFPGYSKVITLFQTGSSGANPGSPNTWTVLQTFTGGITSTGADLFANISGLRFGNSSKFTSVANILTDCGATACPFLLTPAFANTTAFSPMVANGFLLDVRQPTGKYGPMFIAGDLPPSSNNPTGYPSQATGCGGSACDTGLDLGFSNFIASRYFNLTGTTVATNYAPHFEFYYFTGNPTAGGGNKQFVSYYNAVETSRTTGDLLNVSDMKLGNNYLALRAPSFAGTMEGIENDVFYRAAGTISGIQFATESICGIFDNIAANITNTSYCTPVNWDNNGSGAVGQAIMSDTRLTLQMTGGGTQAGVVAYCAFCVQTVTNGGTVTANIVGWDRVGPATLPTFSAGKYWLASVNQPGAATGANVNNDWWQGGDFNNGHMTFAGDGGASATHIWFSQTSGGLRQKNGAAPASSTDGQPIMYSGPPTVVGSLPSCTASLQDQWRVVTDASAPTYNGALTGGGAVRVPVYCNGSAWTSH